MIYNNSFNLKERGPDMEVENNIMVCVTKQKTCEKLIQSGVKIKEEIDGNMFVVHVSPLGANFLDNSHEGEALDYLFQISKSVGADMTVLKSSNIVESMIEFCKKNNIKTVVLGTPPKKSQEDNIVSKLSKNLGEKVEINVI